MVTANSKKGESKMENQEFLKWYGEALVKGVEENDIHTVFNMLCCLCYRMNDELVQYTGDHSERDTFTITVRDELNVKLRTIPRR